jgi:hypothetical protein
MLKFVNTALKQAYDELKANDSTFTATSSPKFLFDPTTYLFRIQLSADYISNTNWELRMSTELFISFFPSFVNFADFQNSGNNLPIQIIINEDFGYYNDDNTIFYLQNEAQCTGIWDQIQKIIFTTNTIPCNPEYISSANGKTESILLDFEPETQVESTLPYQYFANTFRWVNLISNNPLNEIQLAVEVQYKNGDRFPIYIQTNENMTIKMLIRAKKSHLTN